MSENEQAVFDLTVNTDATQRRFLFAQPLPAHVLLAASDALYLRSIFLACKGTTTDWQYCITCPECKGTASQGVGAVEVWRQGASGQSLFPLPVMFCVNCYDSVQLGSQEEGVKLPTKSAVLTQLPLSVETWYEFARRDAVKWLRSFFNVVVNSEDLPSVNSRASKAQQLQHEQRILLIACNRGVDVTNKRIRHDMVCLLATMMTISVGSVALALLFK
eukprot:TRINITY_DN7274_c0_g1_i2.p1 TRINITY_DN7274_c0_g1~~TRINITY_DN7274_c0_g1_i2.p1  ORF type:complete len:218 (-),score=20.70 TRINITY_DN7274_c0_g1_i2:875-1528(-)